MMQLEEQRLVLDLALERISECEFLKKFSVNIKEDVSCITHMLQEAHQSKYADEVEISLLLGFHFGFSKESVGILCELLLEKWHTQHENIASALQRLKDPRAVDCLYKTALTQFAYLDYDESHALAVKCIWALSATNTDAAREKLALLAQSEVGVLRNTARYVLGQANDKM